MNAENFGNELHRSIKLAIDSGEVETLEEAQTLFAGYRLLICVGPDIALSATKQAMLLTIINTARRCFLGGAEVIGCPPSPLLIPWRSCRTLEEAILDLQGSLADRAAASGIPQIVIGDAAYHAEEFTIRPTYDGWLGGVTPIEDTARLNEQQEFIPAGILAGALAVSEAFQFIRGRNIQAGRRAVGVSLWRPEESASWLTTRNNGPVLEYLPSRLWLIGLGHLGQAYLWTLGFLPYANPGDVQLVLHDYDTLVAANDSTSPLTDQRILGRKKTRAMAQWCEERGFQTIIQERRFGANFRLDQDEPQVALCGVDNGAARAALEEVGFAQIIEAGLGRGTEEYLAFQIHSFPSTRSARHYWGNDQQIVHVLPLLENPAYRALSKKGLDQCGLTMLANRAVGASFVGVCTSTLVIAELLRLIIGEQRYEVIDGSLRTPDRLQVFLGTPPKNLFNPGTTRTMVDFEQQPGLQKVSFV